jgi:hypothetical protein
MRYLVEGVPVEGVPTRDLKNLSLGRDKPDVEAVLISADEALRRGRKSLAIRYGFLGAIIVIVPPAGIVADPGDWMVIAPVVVAIWVFFAWFLPFLYRRKIGQFAARMETAILPAPAGSTVRADQAGLAIGGRSWAWSQLALESIGLTRRSTGGDTPSNETILQSLGLTADGATIQLDGNMLSTGNAVLDTIYRRLNPAA